MSGFIQVVDAAELLAGGAACSDGEFESWVGVLRANLLTLGALAPSSGGALAPAGPWVPVTQVDLDLNRYQGDDILQLRLPRARFEAWRREVGVQPQTRPEAPTAGARNKGGAPQPVRVPQPLPRQRHQEQEILRVLAELDVNPLALPPRAPGAPGVKARVRERLRLSYTESQFDHAWERLRADERIKDAG